MQFYICEKLNCAHEEMTVLDIILKEIGPGDLRLEEDVPLLGQAQTTLLVVGVVAFPPCLDGPGDSVKDLHICCIKSIYKMILEYVIESLFACSVLT